MFQQDHILNSLEEEGTLNRDSWVFPCHGGKPSNHTSIQLDHIVLGEKTGKYENSISFVVQTLNQPRVFAYSKEMVLFASSTKKIVTKDYTSQAMETRRREYRKAQNYKCVREILMLSKKSIKR